MQEKLLKLRQAQEALHRFRQAVDREFEVPSPENTVAITGELWELMAPFWDEAEEALSRRLSAVKRGEP